MYEFIVNDIDLKKTYDSGQVFSWYPHNDEYYIPIGSRLYKAKQINTNDAKINVLNESIKNKLKKQEKNEIDLVLSEYFDVGRDYPSLYDEITKKHNELKEGVDFSRGMRLLKQDISEMIITFMLSANNHIPRIRNTLSKIREFAGNTIIEIDGIKFYSFPSLDSLSKLSEEKYKEFGAGYRAAYLCETTKLLSNLSYDDKWKKLKTQELVQKLCELKGIGPKVAHCIVLFGYGRWDSFPIDTWVKKALSKYYGIEKTGKKELEYLIEKKFAKNSALVQQVMFYSLKKESER